MAYPSHFMFGIPSAPETFPFADTLGVARALSSLVVPIHEYKCLRWRRVDRSFVGATVEFNDVIKRDDFRKRDGRRMPREGPVFQECW